MSNGQLHIVFGEYELNGTFRDGSIIEGTIKTVTSRFEGTFDENQQLHGDKCIEVTGTNRRIRRGYFEHGNFIHGESQTIDCKEIGYFAGNYLTEGERWSRDVYYKGTYRAGKLIQGMVTYPNGDTFDGVFDSQTILIRGKITAINGAYQATVHFEDNQTLVNCTANFTCNPRELSANQLMIYCCQGDNPVDAYRFYKVFLRGFSLDGLLRLTPDAIMSSVAKERIGYLQILQNVERLKNYPMPHGVNQAVDQVNLNRD